MMDLWLLLSRQLLRACFGIFGVVTIFMGVVLFLAAGSKVQR